MSMTIGEFVRRAPASLALRVLAGEKSLDARRISAPRIQKLGLALAGFSHYTHPGRVQIVGQSETRYLAGLPPSARTEAVARLELARIACVLITKNLEPPAEFLDAARASQLPVLRTPLVSSRAIELVGAFLRESLAPRETRHGVLLDVYGLGVLIEGRSGIGKSECALDLVSRGARLVADDAVEVRRTGDAELCGGAPEMLHGLMEIRGLGILDVAEVYGVSAVSDSAQVRLVVRLEAWHEADGVDRLGLDRGTIDVLGVEVPLIRLPVSPGRNISTLVDAAVRVHLLRLRGRDAARDFVRRHTQSLGASEQDVGQDVLREAVRAQAEVEERRDIMIADEARSNDESGRIGVERG